MENENRRKVRKIQTKRRRQHPSELLDEVVDVGIDFLCSLLVDEVTDAFHHHDVFQERHVLLEPTAVHVLLHSRSRVCHVQVPNYELHRHLHLHVGPRRR